MNSAFVGYEKFCSSYPNQPHSIVANHSTVAYMRGQPLDFWEGWEGMGNLFFPQTSDHIIFFPDIHVQCQSMSDMSLQDFFPHEISLQDIYFFSEVTALNLQWSTSKWYVIFGHWGTWLYYVFLPQININRLDICFNSRFLNTSWRKVLNLVFNP